MSSIRSRESLEHDVVLLDRQGMSRRAIARALGVSRKWASKVLARHRHEREAGQPSALPEVRRRAPRPSKLDPHRGEIERLLRDFSDITAQRVHEEIRRAGFTGGYTRVKELVRSLRPKPQPTVSLQTPCYGPGEMAECDWSPYTIPFTESAPRILQCFGYALTYSRRKFFRFYSRCDIHALMDGHIEAFSAYGGVASFCKYDSQKPVVLRWEGSQPIYNLRFIDFATYYEMRPKACRPAHPNDKPTVERSFWELERSFLNGRKFRDEEDLHAQLHEWRTTISDLRLSRRTRRTALDLYAEEAPHLRPLPSHPYDTARVVYRLCDVEGFVAWAGNRYSLPYDHVTEILPLRITQRELYVYAADLTLIARHELLPKGAGFMAILPGHRPAFAKRGPDLDQLRAAYGEMGPQAASFLRALEAAQPRNAAYHARMILALRERYQTSDLVAAFEHAERFGALDHRSVERILLGRATPRRLDEYVAEQSSRKLQQILTQSVTEPRDLSEYDALPLWKGPEDRGDRGDPVCAPEDPAPKTSPDDTQDPMTTPPCSNGSKGTSSGSD